jgi:hypothetical protein
MLSLQPSVVSDAEFIARHMRPEDVQEIDAASGCSPESALLAGLQFSDVCLTVHSDEPIAMMGVGASPNPSVGAIWMLSTPALERHATEFLRANKRTAVLDNFHRLYPVLWNHVDERNTKHIRWLKWLGFTFIMRHPFHGLQRRPFLEFVRINTNV